MTAIKPPSGLALDVLRHLKSALVIIDRSGTILIFNAAASKVLGLGPEENLIGRNCREVFSEYPYLNDLLLASFDIHTLPDRAELEIKNRLNGDRKVIGYTLSPVYSDANDRLGTAIFFKDLTEVELEETKEKIRDRLVTLGEMAAWMAHEIRNPLAGIEVAAGILLKGEQDPSRTETVRDILGEVKRLNRIITETLDFVRSRPINLQDCNVNRILLDCLNESVQEEEGVDVELSLGDLDNVLLDDTQISHALSNIIKNSYEAMEGHGKLCVRTYAIPSEEGRHVPESFSEHVVRDNSNLVVEIEDTGVGIPEDIMHRIFTPFFTTKTGGTGIGMSLAQKVVTEHWGFIDVESTPGMGTTFKVILPMFKSIQKGMDSDEATDH